MHINYFYETVISMQKTRGSTRELDALVEECSFQLNLSPACLKTRAIRGHACMKRQKWNMAVTDFTAIIQVRQDDIHGTYSRGMALFKSGQIEAALLDFTKVLALKKDHAMARYARAGCFNIFGQYNEAIAEYTLALRCDKEGREGRGRLNKLYMHEAAEKVVHQRTKNNTGSTRARREQVPNRKMSEDRGKSERTMNKACGGVVPNNPRIVVRRSKATSEPPRVVVDLSLLQQTTPSSEKRTLSRTLVTSSIRNGESAPCTPLPVVLENRAHHKVEKKGQYSHVRKVTITL